MTSPTVEFSSDEEAIGVALPSSNTSSATVVKRIIFLDHTAAMGGGEIALLNLVQNFDQDRYIPVVVLFQEGPVAVALREARVETHILPLDASVGSARKDALGIKTILKFKT